MNTLIRKEQMSEANRNLSSYPDVLTDKDVAEFFDIHRYTVQGMARKGIIFGQKAGNKWFFHKSAIENFLTVKPKR